MPDSERVSREVDPLVPDTVSPTAPVVAPTTLPTVEVVPPTTFPAVLVTPERSPPELALLLVCESVLALANVLSSAVRLAAFARLKELMVAEIGIERDPFSSRSNNSPIVEDLFSFVLEVT